MSREYRIGMVELDHFNEMINKIGKDIEKNNIDKNQHLKTLLQESKRDLVDMMDESYQEAFNLEVNRTEK